ncbi:UNVERIFIED_CONTAM: hypothetical protein RMT77_005458 [Armadillidium vulgare]
MTILSPKLLILSSLCFILTLDLASASSCDYFKKCVFTRACWKKLYKPKVPKNPKIKRAFAGLCKIMDCSLVIKKYSGKIPNNSPVPAKCASLPVRGYPSASCRRYLRRVYKKNLKIPRRPKWKRISMSNVYSTVCHAYRCLKIDNTNALNFTISDVLQEPINLS